MVPTQTCNMFTVIIIYVSALISVECTKRNSNTEHNTAQLKQQLYKSLQQVSHFLSAIEKIIQNERLRKKDHHGLHNGEADNRRDFKVQGVPDINWWNTRPANILQDNPTTSSNIYNTDPTENMFKDVAPNVKRVIGRWIKDENSKRPNDNLKYTLSPPTYGKPVSNDNMHERENPVYKQSVDEWIQNVHGARTQNVPKLILSPTMTVPANDFTPSLRHLEDQETADPFGIDFEYGGINVGEVSHIAPVKAVTHPTTRPTDGTTPVKPSSFVKDLNDQMDQRGVGYLTVFLTKLLGIIITMKVDATKAFVLALKQQVHRMNKGYKLQGLGEPTTSSLLSVTENISELPGEMVKSYSSIMLGWMLNTATYFDPDVNTLLSVADGLYEIDEGDQLFVSLEHLFIFSNNYPKVNSTALIVVEKMMTSLLAPITRLAGTKQQQQFVSDLNKVLSKKLANRRQLGNNKDMGAIVKSQLQKISSRVLQRSHYPQNKRRMKHEKYKHHEKNKTHHNHELHNLRKMGTIRHGTDKTHKKRHHSTRKHRNKFSKKLPI